MCQLRGTTYFETGNCGKMLYAQQYTSTYLPFIYLGTILTIVLLMRAINPMNYADDVEQHLKRLCEIDYYRKEYYSDLGRSWDFTYQDSYFNTHFVSLIQIILLFSIRQQSS